MMAAMAGMTPILTHISLPLDATLVVLATLVLCAAWMYLPAHLLMLYRCTLAGLALLLGLFGLDGLLHHPLAFLSRLSGGNDPAAATDQNPSLTTQTHA